MLGLMNLCSEMHPLWNDNVPAKLYTVTLVDDEVPSLFNV